MIVKMWWDTLEPNAWRYAVEQLRSLVGLPVWVRHVAKLRIFDYCCDDGTLPINDSERHAIARRLQSVFILLDSTPPSFEDALEVAEDYLAMAENMGQILERRGLLKD